MRRLARALLVLGMSWCATAAALDAATPMVAASIDNFTFAPAELVVAPGTRVVWTNHDDIPHTVTGAAGPELVKSPPLDTDDSFGFTFTSPGRYGYFCSLHPTMRGTVVVQ